MAVEGGFLFLVIVHLYLPIASGEINAPDKYGSAEEMEQIVLS